MTPQRRAIVREIMSTNGHISPPDVARRVRERVPGVNPSTIYRTLDLLEGLGILSHAHLESGAEYHHRSEAQHVHLICSNCGAADALSMSEADRLKGVISRHSGFQPDFTHFAISGLCEAASRGLGARPPEGLASYRAPALISRSSGIMWAHRCSIRRHLYQATDPSHATRNVATMTYPSVSKSSVLFSQ